jgi:sugar lactone lactonase YvrE
MIDLADPAHPVTTIAGSTRGLADGPGASARFFDPWGLAAGPDGVVYVSDTYNHRIRRIDTRAPGRPVSTLAGSGPIGSKGGGYEDGPGAKALFHYPRGLVVDGPVLYVADAPNQAIRRIALDAADHGVSTLGGTLTPASRLAEREPLGYPASLVVAHGVIFALDSAKAAVYRVEADGAHTWLVGGAREGCADGFWRGGQFRQPAGIACDRDGNLLVADTGNNRLRLVQ